MITLTASTARELGEALIDAADSIDAASSLGEVGVSAVHLEQFKDNIVALPVGWRADDPVAIVTGVK